jgi:DHA1 family tetracycline resistance protein-like MFS transporter
MSEETDNLDPAPNAVPAGDYAPRFRLLFLIVLIDMLGFGLIIPLLPFYALKFHASALQVTLLLTVYSACQFIATPLLGSLSDRIGRRPVLVFSQLGTTSASLMLGIVTAMHFQNLTLGLTMVYVTRIIDGISGGNVSAAQAYVSDTVPPAKRAKYMGLLGAAFGIAFALGPGIGGVLGHYNEALPPFLAAALSLTAAVLAYFKLPESLKTPIHPDRSSHLLRSAKLFREPILAQLVCVWFLSMFAFVMMESVFALFLNDRFGFKERGVGLTFMLAGVMIIIIQGGLIGRLKDLVGEWSMAIIGPLAFTAAMLLYVQVAFAPVVMVLVIAVIFNAIGRSLHTPAMSSLVAHHSPMGKEGAAFGLFHGMGSLARMIGPAIAGAIYLSDRMWPPFLVGAACTFVAAIWMAAIRLQTRTHTQYAATADERG